MNIVDEGRDATRVRTARLKDISDAVIELSEHPFMTTDTIDRLLNSLESAVCQCSDSLEGQPGETKLDAIVRAIVSDMMVTKAEGLSCFLSMTLKKLGISPFNRINWPEKADAATAATVTLKGLLIEYVNEIQTEGESAE